MMAVLPQEVQQHPCPVAAVADLQAESLSDMLLLYTKGCE